MPGLTIVGRDGRKLKTDVPAGSSVMEIVRANGFDELAAVCGGCCSCATCHVYVDTAFLSRLPAISENEEALLDALDNRRPASRLSCQLLFDVVLDGLVVTIAPEC